MLRRAGGAIRGDDAQAAGRLIHAGETAPYAARVSRSSGSPSAIASVDTCGCVSPRSTATLAAGLALDHTYINGEVIRLDGGRWLG